MIKQIKSHITKSFIVLSIAATLPACINKDEFFLLPDRNGIDAAIWDTEGAVQLHLNRTYDVVIPNFPFQLRPDRYGVQMASDENYFPDVDQWAKAALGLQGTLGVNDVRYTGNGYNYNPGINRYFDVGRCNEAIKNIPLGSIPQATQRVLLGQYHALRAMAYFELVKVYGGVPLPLEPQRPETVYLEGRKSAKVCFDAIISDLNNAITMLDGVVWDDGTGRGKISKLIATCLKAKVLLYWASPQFNPLNDPKHPYDASRWQTALQANKEAYDMCVASGKKLMTNYADIFRVEGTANTEAVLVRTFSNSINARGHNTESITRPSSENGSPFTGFMATKKLLDAYPMRDGNPRGTSTQFPYDDLLFWQNRDPRFEATIAYNGGSWPLSGNLNRRQWTYNTAVGESNGNGVYCKRFTTPTLTAANVPYSNNLGGNGMDWIELRLAEVMLNYADCMNETGNSAGAKDMVRQLRVRANIVQGNNDYGLGNVNGIEQVRTLLINERMIEFAFENKRNSDLRRTRQMHLLNGNMTKLEVQLNVASDKAVLEASTNGVAFRETLNTNDKATYQKYFRHVLTTNTQYLPYNVPEYHYFYTFHNDFVNNGANIATTIGWPGGTFDPLD
ncbi:RagB/SusD family nutrient uptake outer membrane protein [Mucilaginibacter aquatilis]|uniref:RagB/SusD family nutrient uptake outer membrane protein n=1 Tax=Mucilaginibacter aquatilis TaxID=1517760 RepID=A0A6I4IGI3_9SPHI|nr:RagB/SusD family nutrient uptake outer membrane protein [Mucilaginibacter aquatilis]MVN92656.1 RagB/SusD family nutrient uptake outer membrane protein [Mucilaginibacter aquatilis]